ncbi:MAG: ABC transporter permease [Acidobacteria bacterium]|nr:ABC transporter permease [Acidobacteriota bacterium]
MSEWETAVRQLLAPLKLSPEHESEVIEELVQHLEDTYKMLRSVGATHDVALRDAIAELDGNHALLRELRLTERLKGRDTLTLGSPRITLVGGLLQDLRFGFRMIRKNPVFTAIAVLTLALGIGANGAIFSIVNAVLIRELPYPEPDQLVMVWEARPREGVFDNVVSPADFSDWRTRQQVFQHIATELSTTVDLTGTGDPERLFAGNVSAEFFKVFGVQPIIGHDFERGDEQRGKNQVAILSHGLWQRRFGGDRDILGKRVMLNGDPFEVIGILPQAARFPYFTNEIYFPLDFTTETMRARFNHFLTVYARLKPGMTIDGAQRVMDRISAELQNEVELRNQEHGARIVPLREQLVGNIRDSIIILFAAVGLVLLIACVNVANLLLARGTVRRRELALRTALGASRFRIVRQFSVECLWFGVLGALVGVPIAYGGVTLLKTIVPANIPRLNDAGFDLTVFIYMITAAVVTAVMFGIAPAVQLLNVDLSDALKHGNPAAGGSRRWVRGGLVISEIALAFVLLIGAGLLMRSLYELLDVNTGFDRENLLTTQISLTRAQVSPERLPSLRDASSFYERLLENIRSLPTVTGAAFISHLPLSGQDSRTGFSVEGLESTPDKPVRAHWRFITPDYFATMKIRLSEGRLPTEHEMKTNALIAVVNGTAASRYWPGQSPVGKRIRILGPDWREVVGVVEDVRHWGLSAPVNPEVYLAGFRNPAALVVRTKLAPEEVAGAIRAEIQRLEPALPLSSMRTMEELIGRSVAPSRFYLILLGLFAAVALILSCAGIYGVMSYTVNQSTREIGIRMAMGANPKSVVRFFVGKGLVLTAISLALGGVAAYGATRVLRTLLFGITPTDPLTFAAVAAIIVVIGLLACYIPARRAAKVDPLAALRAD